MNKRIFMQKLKDMMGPQDEELIRPTKSKMSDNNIDFDNDDFEDFEDSDDELVINLKFIVDECPETRIVRDWMKENIKSVNEDDPFFKLLEEQI